MRFSYILDTIISTDYDQAEEVGSLRIPANSSLNEVRFFGPIFGKDSGTGL